jgi:hypothetical protein
MVGVLTMGCSQGAQSEGETTGTLNLPLSTVGSSGSEYRLRDAVFVISPDYWNCNPGGTGGAMSTAGTASGGSGSTACPPAVTVSSETDPAASAISVTLERGYYVVELLPGWRMEKIEAGVASDVEAQLLSPASQWTYVSERSTTWLEYQFGLGDRELWFNGDLNINIRVFEDPSEIGGGFGGTWTTGGSMAGGSGPVPAPGTGGTTAIP